MSAEELDALGAVCRHALAGSGEIQIGGLRRIADGWECDVYAFTASGTAEGIPSDLILRRYYGEDAASKVEAECTVLDQLGTAGYPVPRVFARSADAVLGRPFAIMEKIDGVPLGSIMRRPDRVPDAELLRRFVELVVRLHRFDWRVVTPDTRFFPIQAGLDGWIRWVKGILATFNLVDYDEALAWLEAQATGIEPRPLAIVHQDFHPWNVLVRADGAAFVIDWTQADLLDPRLDLAWTTLLMSGSFDPSIRERILAEYEALAGPVRDFAAFEVAAAVKRLASITLSLDGGAEKLGMRPGAEARMREERHHLQTAHAIYRDRTGLRIPRVERLLAE